MEQYIPKSALVAEMNKLKNISLEYGYTTEQKVVANVGKDLTLKRLLDYTDTIEVKEVDFDAEWERYFEHRGEMATVNVKHLAKYFFELGIKAQKGE